MRRWKLSPIEADCQGLANCKFQDSGRNGLIAIGATGRARAKLLDGFPDRDHIALATVGTYRPYKLLSGEARRKYALQTAHREPSLTNRTEAGIIPRILAASSPTEVPSLRLTAQRSSYLVTSAADLRFVWPAR